jgi:hypothetical protein
MNSFINLDQFVNVVWMESVVNKPGHAKWVKRERDAHRGVLVLEQQINVNKPEPIQGYQAEQKLTDLDQLSNSSW